MEIGELSGHRLAEQDCPGVGKMTPRWILTKVDDDHWTFEHQSKSAFSGDQYARDIELKATRRK